MTYDMPQFSNEIDASGMIIEDVSSILCHSKSTLRLETGTRGVIA